LFSFRDEVEHDLIFGGLIVYENKLKLQTTPVLRELQSASIRTVMITGDNLLTAIAISKSCGMVGGDHHVIIVKATPTSDNIPPRLSYFLFDSDKSDLSRLTSSGGFSGHYQTLNSNNEIGIQIEGKAFTEMSHNSLYAKEYFHLALDGVTYSIICDYYPELLPKVLVSGTVFARMSPFHKKQLVTNFMDLGYGVAMCGDGANDCGALKAAHVGISLSETEASVASPFTSKIPNISCVPIAIKEGRAALVTSFGIFKFMALYSLTEFTSVAMLYAIESNLGDFHYLYIDLVLILAFAFVMGLTGPYPRLVKRRPLGTLAGVRVFASVLTQLFLMASVQLSVFFYLRTEYWFTPLVPDQETDNISCFETTAVFCVSIFQYVSLAIAFSTAAPYRRPLYTNSNHHDAMFHPLCMLHFIIVLFMLCLLILLPANLYLALAPPNWLPQVMNVLLILYSLYTIVLI
jgi:predicted P-type ATPase